MSQPNPLARLLTLWGEIVDLERTEGLLEWDQETVMPAKGVAGRGKLASTLARARHERLVSAELAEAIAAVREGAAPGSDQAAQAAEAERLAGRARKVPADLAAALAEAKSGALAAWQQARAEARFATFAPHLERLVALKKEEAAAVSGGARPYDALLDLYEPGSTEAALVPLFADLTARLAPLVEAVAASGTQIDESAVLGTFPAEVQRQLALEVLGAIGFDLEAGRLDPATHPFCIGIHGGDTRLTWRWQEDDLRPGLYGILHEGGHGLYEQGLPPAWERTPLGAAVSLGIHESQSRLWENHVGRGRPFLRWLLPRLRAHFPFFVGQRVERIWPVLHQVRPSLIRVEADEVTYNLHVAVRFEIERALFGGEVAVADLPATWDDLYGRFLGLRPGNAAEGVLQDIHWSLASFGYFPTYTLGTLAAAQLWQAAERDLPDLEEAIARGELSPLLGWLREHVHRWGSRWRPAELIERATGGPLSAEPFLAYVEATTREVYGLA
ncbi:MAG TPA: carboxypeptidase M32 [Thermoanaerobaculia bacterium]|nr:carboxypeptidase M32 [Thermoanaerobaculia bacterium]